MRVIIVGGGFGGVRAALNLANKKGFAVKLLSGQSYFEYHAALYRSATGRSPLEVAIPLVDFFAYAKNVEVVKDTVTGLDSERQLINGQTGTHYPYDTLILALGSITEYYGIRGLQEYSYGVKSIQEALKLKRHLHEQLLDKKAESNYVVIGGGATGIELAGEMASYLKAVRRRHQVVEQFKVDLIEASPRVVMSLPQSYSKAIQKRLQQLGINIYLDTTVKAESVEGISLPNGQIQTHTVVWTAGTTNNPFFAQFPKIFKLGSNQRVKIDRHLRVTPEIFVIGDSADTPFSGMAQTALHDANFVTNNLFRQAKGLSYRSYSPKRPIYAIPVGRHWAVVLWGKVQITGILGWVLRRLADLRLYVAFLPFSKALTIWRYGFVDEEICRVCQK